MSQPPAMTVDVRRALVRQLIEQDPTLSARKIADQIGVGKDTVLRDLKAIRQAQEQPPPDPAATEPQHAPDAPAPEAAPAPRDPFDEPLRRWLTPEARADLALLMEAGHSPGYAVRRGLEVLAVAYRGAWERGLCPRGTAPEITHVNVSPCNPRESRP
ncbi:helix-turn-helix domain-containing protein [Streptomyces blattellae]|uniref:helix-turn-helix domain-containing protein n=1 Tax=Streptomyces blattellae TaxID=2569855 RepID=UPI0012B7C755|nr:helix-turn-helix domain-containing protein [Streptomyces blattellae]